MLNLRRAPLTAAAMLLCLGAGGLSACNSGDDGARLAAIRASLTEARDAAVRADEVRREAVAAVPSRHPSADSPPGIDLEPEPTTPCPIEVTLDGAEDPRFVITRAAAVAESPGPRAAASSAAHAQIAAAALLDSAPSAEALASLEARVAEFAKPWPYDVTLRTSEFSTPRYSDEGAFHPGMVDGDLIVWDYAAERVACVARVTVTNSSTVMDGVQEPGELRTAFEADPAGYLMDDLMTAAIRAGLADLHAAP